MDCNGHSNDNEKETMYFPSMNETDGHKKSRQKRRLSGENIGGKITTREEGIRIRPHREEVLYNAYPPSSLIEQVRISYLDQRQL